ncbi:MAG: helix-turn-helix domain-containing protein [bacterium]|nr:helix-turn-helix domain-containing protein [bacterium]
MSIYDLRRYRKKAHTYDTGVQLEKVRQALNYTRKRMATYLGLGFSGYYKNELGMTFPSQQTLKVLSSRLGISMDWLIFHQGPMYLSEKAGSEAGKLLQDNPDIHEVVKVMVEYPVLKYELLADFQRLKARNKDLFDPSSAPPRGEG